MEDKDYLLCDINCRKIENIDLIFKNISKGLMRFDWKSNHLSATPCTAYREDLDKPCIDELEYRESTNELWMVHPDDIEECRNIFLIMLKNYTYLDHVYRAKKETDVNYHWIRITAIVVLNNNTNYRVWALYNNITIQKKAELFLKNNQNSLIAALGTSNQFCSEYDPVLHTLECYSNAGFPQIPKFIEKFPEDIKKYDLIYEEDVPIFEDALKKIDAGSMSERCDIRIKNKDKYSWYVCKFYSYYNPKKERTSYIFSILDAYQRIDSRNTSSNYLDMMVREEENFLCISCFNLTQNTIFNFIDSRGVNEEIKKIVHFDELVEYLENKIYSKEDKLNFKNLIKDVQNSSADKDSFVKMECMYKTTNDVMEWVEISFCKSINPKSGDIEGIWRIESINNMKMANILLKRMLETDYIFTAILFEETSNFYLYSKNSNERCLIRNNFWTYLASTLNYYTKDFENSEISAQRIRNDVNKQLAKGKDYIYIFDGEENKKVDRFEFRVSYLDKPHKLAIATLRYITDKKQIETLQYMAKHDKLTGLYNRDAVFSKCREVLDKNTGEQFLIIYFNIKNYSLYTSFFGTKAADDLICSIADNLKTIRIKYPNSMFGRIEAVKFCVLIPYVKNQLEKQCEIFLRQLKNYRNDFLFEPQIGIYIINDTSISIESMYSRAVIAASYSTSEKPVQIFDKKMEQELTENQIILSEMSRAIKEEEFKVYLQPKYNLFTNQVIGSEALVRWQHPKWGLLSPGRFIPLFENNGYISDLDRYMWEHVCHLIRKWLDSGKTVLPVSVNMSRVSIYAPNTVEFLKMLIKKYNIDPKYLELELTETSYMNNPEEIKTRLEELQEFGFKIYMDDFGSGYSSLNTLRELPVDYLKLDLRFLTDLSNDTRGRSIIASIVQMAKLLNIPVIAEGVEKGEQIGFLRSIGCETAQGFIFSKPTSIEYFEDNFMNGQVSLEKNENENIDPNQYRLQRLLSDTSDSLRLLTETLPICIAFASYSEGKIQFLRVNKKFMLEFKFEKKHMQFVDLIKDYLDEKDYNQFVDLLKTCVETKSNKKIILTSELESKNQYNFLISSNYEGKISNNFILLVTFVNLP